MVWWFLHFGSGRSDSHLFANDRRAISEKSRSVWDTRVAQPCGGVDLARGFWAGRIAGRARRGFTKSPSCLGHRVPSAIAAAVAGYTSRRGNNAAHYCRLALSPTASRLSPAIARGRTCARGCRKIHDLKISHYDDHVNRISARCGVLA